LFMHVAAHECSSVIELLCLNRQHAGIHVPTSALLAVSALAAAQAQHIVARFQLLEADCLDFVQLSSMPALLLPPMNRVITACSAGRCRKQLPSHCCHDR
jgi:hypothetical protein